MNCIEQDALCRIYARLSRTSSPFRDEIFEHALGLILKGRRSAASGAYLERQVLQNASFTVSRRRASSSPFVSARAPESLTDERGAQFDDVASTLSGNVNSSSPEELLILKEKVLHLFRRVSKLGIKGLICLDGMVDELSLEEIALLTGSTARQVKYLRKKIRGIAAKILL